MTIRKTLTVVLSTILLAGASTALPQFPQTASAPVELRTALAGRWTGALEYRDYQSDALVELPVETTIEALPDEATIIRRSVFDDGPGKVVLITTVSVDDRDEAAIRSASFRAGGTPEVLTETVAVGRYIAIDDWTLVYTALGTDDDIPATIRITETRSGDALTAVKEVRPINGAEGEWSFRNRLHLTRQGPERRLALDRRDQGAQ